MSATDVLSFEIYDPVALARARVMTRELCTHGYGGGAGPASLRPSLRPTPTRAAPLSILSHNYNLKQRVATDGHAKPARQA